MAITLVEPQHNSSTLGDLITPAVPDSLSMLAQAETGVSDVELPRDPGAHIPLISSEFWEDTVRGLSIEALLQENAGNEVVSVQFIGGGPEVRFATNEAGELQGVYIIEPLPGSPYQARYPRRVINFAARTSEDPNEARFEISSATNTSTVQFDGYGNVTNGYEVTDSNRGSINQLLTNLGILAQSYTSQREIKYGPELVIEPVQDADAPQSETPDYSKFDFRGRVFERGGVIDVLVYTMNQSRTHQTRDENGKTPGYPIPFGSNQKLLVWLHEVEGRDYLKGRFTIQNDPTDIFGIAAPESHIYFSMLRDPEAGEQALIIDGNTSQSRIITDREGTILNNAELNGVTFSEFNRFLGVLNQARNAYLPASPWNLVK